MTFPQIRTRKKLLLIITAAVLCVAAAGGGWFWLAQTAKQRYITDVQAFRASTAADLQAFDAQFTALTDTNDATVALLTTVETKVSSLLAGAPKEPHVLGIQVATPQSQSDANATKQWLFSLQQALTESREFIAYKSQVLTHLKELTGKKGSNADEQQTLTDLWKETYVKLQAIKPPAKAASVHTELTSSVESISATLSSLPELYNKKDYAGFIAKQKELDSKIAGLRALHQSFEALSNEHDQAIGLQLRALKP